MSVSEGDSLRGVAASELDNLRGVAVSNATVPQAWL